MQSSDLIRNFESAQSAKERADADLEALLAADLHWLRSLPLPSFPSLPSLPAAASALTTDHRGHDAAPPLSTRANRMKARSELKAAPPSSRRAQRRAAVKAKDRLAQEAVAAAANMKLLERARRGDTVSRDGALRQDQLPSVDLKADAGVAAPRDSDEGYATAPGSPLPPVDSSENSRSTDLQPDDCARSKPASKPGSKQKIEPKPEGSIVEEPSAQQTRSKPTRAPAKKRAKEQGKQTTVAASATPPTSRRPRRAAAARAAAAMTATATAPRGRARLRKNDDTSPIGVKKIPGRTTRAGGKRAGASPERIVDAEPKPEPVPEPGLESRARFEAERATKAESDESHTPLPDAEATSGAGPARNSVSGHVSRPGSMSMSVSGAMSGAPKGSGSAFSAPNAVGKVGVVKASDEKGTSPSKDESETPLDVFEEAKNPAKMPDPNSEDSGKRDDANFGPSSAERPPSRTLRSAHATKKNDANLGNRTKRVTRAAKAKAAMEVDPQSASGGSDPKHVNRTVAEDETDAQELPAPKARKQRKPRADKKKLAIEGAIGKRGTRLSKHLSIDSATSPWKGVSDEYGQFLTCLNREITNNFAEGHRPLEKRDHRAIVLPWRVVAEEDSDASSKDAHDVPNTSAKECEGKNDVASDTCAVSAEKQDATDCSFVAVGVDRSGSARTTMSKSVENPLSRPSGEPNSSQGCRLQRKSNDAFPGSSTSIRAPVESCNAPESPPSVDDGIKNESNRGQLDCAAMAPGTTATISAQDDSESEEEVVIRRPRTRRGAAKARTGAGGAKSKAARGRPTAKGMSKERPKKGACVKSDREMKAGSTKNALASLENFHLSACRQRSPDRELASTCRVGSPSPSKQGHGAALVAPASEKENSPDQGSSAEQTKESGAGLAPLVVESPVGKNAPVIALEASRANPGDVSTLTSKHCSPAKEPISLSKAQLDGSGNRSPFVAPTSRKKGETGSHAEQQNAESLAGCLTSSPECEFPSKVHVEHARLEPDGMVSNASNRSPASPNPVEEMPPPPLPAAFSVPEESEFLMPPPPSKKVASTKPSIAAQTPVLRRGKSAIPRLSAAPGSQSRFQVDGKGKLNMAGIGALNEICSTPLAASSNPSNKRFDVSQSGARPSKLFAATGDIYSSTRKPSHARVRPVLSSAKKTVSSTQKAPGMSGRIGTQPSGIRAPIDRLRKKDTLANSTELTMGAPRASSLFPAKVSEIEPQPSFNAQEQVSHLGSQKIDHCPSSLVHSGQRVAGLQRQDCSAKFVVGNGESVEYEGADPKTSTISSEDGASSQLPVDPQGDVSRKRPSFDSFKTAPSKTQKRARIAFAEIEPQKTSTDAKSSEGEGLSEAQSTSKEPRTAPNKTSRRPRIVTTKSALRSRIEGRRIAADAACKEDVVGSDANVIASANTPKTGSSTATPSVGENIGKLSSSTVAGDSSGPSGSISNVGPLSSARARIAAASLNVEAPVSDAQGRKTTSKASSEESQGVAEHSDVRGPVTPVSKDSAEFKPPSTQLGNLMTSISSFLPSFRTRKPEVDETADEKASAAQEIAEAEANRRAEELLKRREAARLAKQKDAEEKQRRAEAKRQLMAQAERHREEERRRKEQERSRKLLEAEEHRKRQKEEEERRRELKRKRVEEQQKRLAAQEAERRNALEEKERLHRERLKRAKAATASGLTGSTHAGHASHKAGPHGNSSAAGAPKSVAPESYEMTASKDNPDRDSSDSDAGQSRPAKRIPNWARSSNLPQSLVGETRDPDSIFEKVKTINLEEVFQGHQQKRRFRSRTSSGMWVRDRLTAKEELEYKKVTTGFSGVMPPAAGSDS